MSKRLGGIKGCIIYKTSSWHLNGFPMEITLGQQYNVGEKPTVCCNIVVVKSVWNILVAYQRYGCSEGLDVFRFFYSYRQLTVGYS